MKGFVEHWDDDEHLLVTIGDLFWTPCNFDPFYARPFRETATTAEQTRQAETEAGVTWSLRGSGCLVTLLEALQVLLILMILMTMGTKSNSQLGPKGYFSFQHNHFEIKT